MVFTEIYSFTALIATCGLCFTINKLYDSGCSHSFRYAIMIWIGIIVPIFLTLPFSLSEDDKERDILLYVILSFIGWGFYFPLELINYIGLFTTIVYFLMIPLPFNTLYPLIATGILPIELSYILVPIISVSTFLFILLNAIGMWSDQYFRRAQIRRNSRIERVERVENPPAYVEEPPPPYTP